MAIPMTALMTVILTVQRTIKNKVIHKAGLQKPAFLIVCKYMNKYLLLSYEEYTNLPEVVREKVPYIYSITSKEQWLCYFGVRHVMDPKHPQIEMLHQEWLSFLSKVPKEKTIVIYEGNIVEKSMTTLEESIKKFGETGAIVFWAKEANILTYRPEPTIEYEANELLKEFSKEDIFYFYIMRGIVSWQRKLNPGDFDEFIVKNIKRYKEALHWADFVFSFDTVTTVHEKLFGKEFSLENKEFLRRIQDHSFSETHINEISRQSIRIRDFFILESIEKYWKEGYNIFVVYGSLHAKMQERAIKDMVEKT